MAATQDDWLEALRGEISENLDPFETARRLRRRIRGLKLAEQRRVLLEALDCLLRENHCFGVVFFLLEGISDSGFLLDIAERIEPLPGLRSDDEESHLADLIRVLAAAGEEALDPPVETYLLQRAIGPHWASVPWAIWPRRRELFARSWVRFFRGRDLEDWTNTLVVKSFLAEPEAILAVRAPLKRVSEPDWSALRDALLRQAGGVGWLSAEQRAALDRALR